MVVFRVPCTVCPFLAGTDTCDSHELGNTAAPGSDMPVARSSGPGTSQGGPSACRISFGPHVPGLDQTQSKYGWRRLSPHEMVPFLDCRFEAVTDVRVDVLRRLSPFALAHSEGVDPQTPAFTKSLGVKPDRIADAHPGFKH